MRSFIHACAAALFLGCIALASGCSDKGIPNIKEPERAKDTARVILSGVIANERNPQTGLINEPVLKMDTGEKLVLFNPAYVNTLRDQVGKQVRIKGSLSGPTSFKGYRGIIIDDILEVEK